MSTTELSLLADQWHLTHMQLVNWGTFCGYQELQLCDQTGAPAQVVMITGESGTGKSTLFDAKTAVMMRGTTRFNTASNQTTGRARGSRERNLYSYVMGKQDDEYDPATGEARESYLRRTDGANWSAIALTFVSTAGQTFCACRLYYVSAHATGTPDAWYLTADEELDPRAMEAHVQGKFGRPQLRSAYPRARIYDGPEAFLRAVYRQLGIGQDGNGESAMKLHERIQAGTTITNVDALFKDLVIDEPGTFAKAEEACQSFVEHEATWEEMDRARRKTQDLKDIRSVHDEHERLRDFIVNKLHRGCSLYNVVGGYTGKQQVEVESLLSKDEFAALLEFIKTEKIEHFITAGNVSEIYGLWHHAHHSRKAKA